MFGETTIFHVKIWNHPIETTILEWMFQVPGKSFKKAAFDLLGFGVGWPDHLDVL